MRPQGRDLRGREGLNAEKKEMARISNLEKKAGSLADMLIGADVFIGVSAPGTVTAEMVKSMAKNPILFPMANPTPEIMPDIAKEAGAAVVGTGRSDFPNQINNVLAFPGIFRGALDVRASQINDEMKIAASYAIAGIITPEELSADCIIPSAMDPRVARLWLRRWRKQLEIPASIEFNTFTKKKGPKGPFFLYPAYSFSPSPVAIFMPQIRPGGSESA